MKRLDKNLKISMIALAVFVVFLIAFSVLSSLVQDGTVSDFTATQGAQGILVFAMFLPLCASMFFVGRYFKLKNGKAGGIMIFVSVALLALGILQAFLSLVGFYG